MLEILCKLLFFLSMLVVYANVTSTNIVIIIVIIYVACVFSYYYFDTIQGVIDEWLNYFNFNARFNDTVNSSHVTSYLVNRKFNKLSSDNAAMASVGNKKMFNTLCNSDGTLKENILESRSMMKPNGDLPSPIMKNGSSLRSNRFSRDSLKLSFNTKSEINGRKNVQPIYGPLGPNRRYNANLDLETYMNVNSPGFTSRVVDKATESASYHIKYPAVRQIPAYRFDKSTLRQLSKIPKANSSPAVRIAPPDPNSIELVNAENLISEPGTETIRSNDYLQVLKDISRKRNYCQEDTDRNVTTPKKSRKNEMKNAVSSQYKRAHEDCSNDSVDDKSCKKRCDDVDRNYAKIMSFTSSMSVLVPEFSWSNNSKKRKSSRLEKSKNESPEKMEKCRKIDEDSDEVVQGDESEKSDSNVDTSVSNKSKELVQHEQQFEDNSLACDDTDSLFSDSVSPADDNEEYIRVAGGKILNRTNCMYRKKLNSTKIDPVSVISVEPEYVTDVVYVDDKTMKENLLNNLVNDIERKGEKNDSVIFYQNSIVEEIEKKTTTLEVQKTSSSVLTSSALNPLLPPTTKLSVAIDQVDAPSSTLNAELSKPAVSSSLSCLTQSSFNNVAPVESSNLDKINLLSKPTEKINCSPVTSVSTFNPLLPPSTSLVSSSQFTIPISTPASVSNMSSGSGESKQPISAIGSSPNVFGNFNKTDVATTTSGVASVASLGSCSTPSFNGSIPTNSQLPISTTSVSGSNSLLPVSNATVNMPQIAFGNSSQTSVPSATSNTSNSTAFTFNKPVNAETTSNTPVFNSSGTVSFDAVSAPSSFATSNNSSNTASASFAVPTTTSATSFSVPAAGVTFGSMSTTQSQVPTFNFGATQSASTFGQSAISNPPQSSVFNNIGSNSQPSIFGQSPANNTAQSNIFGGTSQLSKNTGVTASSLFGSGSSQPSVSMAQQSSVFGANTQPETLSSTVFGSNAASQPVAAGQPSIFNSSAPLQPPQSTGSTAVTAQVQSSLYSTGDTSNSVFNGQNQSNTPPVGVVNPLPQTPQFGSGSAPQFGSGAGLRFSFGGGSTTSQPISFGSTQTPAAAPAPVPQPTPFGSSNTAQQPSSFGGANNGTSSFSFTGGSSTFGADANTINAAASSAPPPAPAAAPVFNFGPTNPIQAPQSAFQFGGTSSAPAPTQPFLFGGSAAPTAANAGGFSIGTGGSTSRNRAMARPRKAK